MSEIDTKAVIARAEIACRFLDRLHSSLTPDHVSWFGGMRDLSASLTDIPALLDALAARDAEIAKLHSLVGHGDGVQCDNFLLDMMINWRRGRQQEPCIDCGAPTAWRDGLGNAVCKKHMRELALSFLDADRERFIRGSSNAT